MERIDCCEQACGRSFVSFDLLGEHLKKVHSQSEASARDAVDQSRKFNTKQRKAAASKGQAMKDGSFPIANEQDLKNAISAFGRAKNKAAAKAHIIKRAKALGLTKLLPDGWTTSKAALDQAQARLVACPNCDRSFRDDKALFDHSDYVHTFEDLRTLVGEKIRETYAKPSTGNRGSTWAWVQDMTDQVVYFMVEEPKDSKTYQATYSISGTTVTLGSPTEVVRRTVYEPVTSESGK